MLKNRLLLSLVTGGIGFGLSLLILRDFKMAAYTGLMGFVASQAGVLVTSSQHEEHLRDRREELRGHIRALQQRRSNVYEELAQLQAQCAEFSHRAQQLQRSTVATPGNAAIQNPWTPKPTSTGSNGPSAQRVSWNLTEPRQSATDIELDELTQRIQALSAEEAALQAAIQDDLGAKQKAELHRTTSEAELQQLQAQIREQTALKQTLNQTILELEQQQQQLQSHIPQLQTQIHELEEYRTTIDAQIQSHKTAKPSAGETALQGAIDQMQSQIAALRGELSELETQIIDRRNQKQLLDQAIESQASNQATITAPPPAPTDPPAANTRLPAVTTTTTPAAPPPPAAKSTTSKAPSKAGQKTRTKPATTAPQTTDGLSTEWRVFKGKLQPYEFQALCAIALEENPTSVLKHLAESNLTMPEMLIDTINEQALDAIGDLILEAGRDAASTIIAQEYRDEVATLIATHR
ncbi:hypothetical protein IQ266_21540 [filamentous cyanobacterium LEGE 11480]|uniref:TerB-C domain-containing protein n=1 Tax=Romeriopsis navalis LEGE 11480 TaxID=2777977 RepID=A0A928VPX4_9CYAN|nr:tellurite resistance TerB C-terminal domain-containing protein [Romeriopsis navalis]MBE9032325.1 hypothetical protein [Romeriopsis navalis LEGE 11480]